MEIMDDLISHMNDARKRFRILTFSSLIMAPIAIAIAVLVIVHPFYLRAFITGTPTPPEPFPPMWSTLLFYVVLTMTLCFIWLYVGLKEYRFLSRWNDRYKRFITLQKQVDRELEKGIADEEQ